MKSILFIALAVLLCICVKAQSPVTVSGHVFYAETKKPVPFAYVRLEGIAYGTVTDYDGSFSLKIPQQYRNEVLSFSYLGLKTKKLKLSDYQGPVKIYLDPDVKQLTTVVITGKRDLNAKSILKKAIRAIPENFVSEDFQLTGYVREFVEENGKAIKYADATFDLSLKGYGKKAYKKKAYERPDKIMGVATMGSITSKASSLHRWHFHQSVLKGEKSQIIESRASEDLTKTRLMANIQGGPLSPITKDRVKYLKNFMDEFNKYEYQLTEVEKDGEPYYVIDFQPKLELDKYEKKKRLYNNPYKLGGTIEIKKEDLAITALKYSVPPPYKKHICGFRGWAIRHFDFSVHAKYEKYGDKYALAFMEHSDEFIIDDTLSQVRIPYAAITQFYTKSIDDHKTIAKADNFSNSDFNALFDHPILYNKKYWKEYAEQNQFAEIPKEIIKDMADNKPLAEQFESRLVRDTTLTPPVARKESYAFNIHGKTYTDDYMWLKDTLNPRANTNVMNYLAAENKYLDNYMRPLRQHQKKFFHELASYVDEDYQSLPVLDNGYRYFHKYTPQQEYPVYYRSKDGQEKATEVLFDVNKMAENKPYYAFGGHSISPNNQIAAYSENTKGNDEWMLKFKDLRTNQILDDSVNFISNLAWLNDSVIFYAEAERKTFRAHKIYKYHLGNGKRELIYHEKDRQFSLGISTSRSKKYIFISIGASDQGEIHFLDLRYPDQGFKVIAPRREGHVYSVYHFKDKFYILTDHKAPNNKLMVTDTSRYQEKYWKTYIEHNPKVQLIDFMPFEKFMVYQEKHGLEYKTKVTNLEEGKSHYIKQWHKDKIQFGDNRNFDTDSLQYVNRSYRWPDRVHSYNMKTKKGKLIKTMGKFNSLAFCEIKIVYAKSKDGTKIPITLIYNKQLSKRLEKNGTNSKLFIAGYGSYGTGHSPGYNPNIYPLIENGYVYAYAHTRGGDDLGKAWYENGKLLHKKNTFEDFIACTEYLIEEGYGEKGKVIAQGGSAGGLLMGAIANTRPDLYGLVVLDVPFVDVVNTMLDDRLPLTTGEYKEWGNPNEKKYFKYIRSYSPYDNVKPQAYPHMIFVTGLNDTRVGYWEPAKMVAKLREQNTSDNEILLYTDFSAGHGGASGRYERLSSIAMRYALVMDLMNQKE